MTRDVTKMILDVKALVDNLRAVGNNYGLSGSAEEYEVITQVFLYKFLNDKFAYAVKKERPEFNVEGWESIYEGLSEDDIEDLFDILDPDVPRFRPQHTISYLWNRSKTEKIDKLLDNTLLGIADENKDVFYTQTSNHSKILLFKSITGAVRDETQRASFARALLDALIDFSFEDTFNENHDFFATIFEYLIKDYNTAGGGVYSEYYTPHAIASIMAELLVDDEKIKNKEYHDVECYDPSAGTGTLLMSISNKIGTDYCMIYSQDISNKSNNLIKLNLVLNGLIKSMDNIIQGNTLTQPYHKNEDGSLKQFDFVVSNPPFKGDFSEYRDVIASDHNRFWGGVPNVKPKEKDKMAIYTCFIQHVVNSIKLGSGRGAIVVPAGFLSGSSGVERNVLLELIERRILCGCIAMPSNIFATTGTNVAVLFFDASGKNDSVMLINASKMGEDYNDGKSKKKKLRDYEIEQIVSAYKQKQTIDGFSIPVDYGTLSEKKSLNAGRYFSSKSVDIGDSDFDFKQATDEIKSLFEKSSALQKEITEILEQLSKEGLND